MARRLSIGLNWQGEFDLDQVIEDAKVADEAGIEVVSGLRVETLRNRDEGYINFMEDNIELIVETLKNLP